MKYLFLMMIVVSGLNIYALGESTDGSCPTVSESTLAKGTTDDTSADSTGVVRQ